MLTHPTSSVRFGITVEVFATMSSKGQVVIDGEVRERLSWVQGAVLRFVTDVEGVRLLPPAGDVRRLKGRLAKPKSPVSIDDMNAAVAEHRKRTSGHV